MKFAVGTAQAKERKEDREWERESEQRRFSCWFFLASVCYLFRLLFYRCCFVGQTILNAFIYLANTHECKSGGSDACATWQSEFKLESQLEFEPRAAKSNAKTVQTQNEGLLYCCFLFFVCALSHTQALSEFVALTHTDTSARTAVVGFFLHVCLFYPFLHIY